ncbi:Ig-like domain-containing protein [Chitinophaga alhagiae]|uniref:Ig-like domain-containing protein n=1 Tax=Chitinophaga alhagiae TaxID=2203219 RepID=UPI000E5BD588|nr:Ig-like domain-containing protein [Chitinophaga alhagiae]
MKKLYKYLFIGACYVLLSTNAQAQVVSGNGFLKADFIEAGIQANGAFGSTVKSPENFFYSTRPDFEGRVGFISDVGKDGWTVGSPAYIGDYFLPGSPYEGFSVQVDGTLHLNSGWGHNAIPGSVTGFSTTDVSQTVEWTGNINNLEVRQEFSVEKTKGFILVRVYLTNKGTTTLNNIYYTREVDPDNEVAQGGDYNTKNVIEQQNPNAISTALISAQGLMFSSYLGLGSRDCRAKVSVPTGWPNANGSQIWAGTGQALSTVGNVTGDRAMSIAFKVGNLAAGESTALAFAYVLNASDLPDAMDRTDPLFNVKTTSYSSGSSIDVCAGQEQIVEVVNGDGFSWTWAPATGLNTTTGSSVKATLTGPMTYTASGVNTCGTTRSITITLNPAITAPPEDAAEITGRDTVFAGLNASYSIPVIEGASSYNWTLPPGVTFVSGYKTNTITVNFGPSATGGNISVEGVNGCGTGASTTIEVQMVKLPAPVSAGGSPTSIKQPVITGNAEPGLTVTLYNGSTVIGSAATDADGNYTITPTSSLAVGTHTLTVKASDGAGTTSSASEPLLLTITAKPPKPATPVLVSGSSPLNEGKPGIKGTAQPNSTVTVYEDGAPVGATTADADGNWTFVPDNNLADGPHELTATAKDAEGNESDASDALLFSIDTELPAKPVMALASGSSPVSNSQPSLSGTAEANSTVTIYTDGVETGTATADADGKWSFALPAALADGPYVFTATATDAAGNVSAGPATLNIIIDTQAPAQPVAGLTEGSTPIKNNEPSLGGTAEPNSTVTIYVNGTLTGTATADADGNWTYTIPSPLTDGPYTMYVTTTDAAGNISVDSETLSITIDTEAPAKPAVELAAGTSPLKNNQPALGGNAEANSTVHIYVNDVEMGTAIADASGKWSYTFPSALPDGAHSITITAEDAAGNASSTSEKLDVVIDTGIPAAPSLPVLPGNSNGHSGNNQPAFTGTAEANSTVIIYVNGEAVGTATADVTGKWSYTIPAALEDGNHAITTTVTDAAGNTSPASEALNVVIDTEVPVAPSAPALSGSNNGHSNSGQPAFTGTAEANSTVNIYVDGVVVGTATADANGQWSYTLPATLADGPHTISTTATDAAGNTSAASEAISFTVDTEVPVTAPLPVLAGEQNGRTKNNTPTLSGTAEPHTTVTIYNNGEPVGTAEVSADGTWSFTPGTALADGENSITTTVTDAAGNTSAPGEALLFTVDTQLPVPVISSAATVVKGPFQVDIVFNEAVEGFDVSAITLSNGTASGFTRISAAEYRITVTPVSENDVTVRVNTGAVPDLAGNGNRESNILTVQAAFSAVVETVFPNPSRGKIYIRYNGVVPSAGTAIMISVSGQTVLRQQLGFEGNMLTVNAAGLAPGIYVLIVNTKNYSYKTRVSIIR